MRLAAYIPCYNNAATLRRAVESILAQTLPIAEVLVLDDGSTDSSLDTLGGLPVRIVRQPRNTGRGAVRARAMELCDADWVLCVDATNIIPPDFVERALPWLRDSRVAGIFGQLTQPPAGDAVHRWRGRHLFKIPPPGASLPPVDRRSYLATYAALVRRDPALAVGNFDPSFRHSEDSHLGWLLLRAGWDIVCDPALQTISISDNTLRQVLERYWRWHAGVDQRVTWPGYWKNITYSFKIMAASDLRQRDPLAALISLACPHYQFWRSKLGARS